MWYTTQSIYLNLALLTNPPRVVGLDSKAAIEDAAIVAMVTHRSVDGPHGVAGHAFVGQAKHDKLSWSGGSKSMTSSLTHALLKGGGL